MQPRATTLLRHTRGNYIRPQTVAREARDRLVSLVYLACLVCLVEPDRPDRPDKADQPPSVAPVPPVLADPHRCSAAASLTRMIARRAQRSRLHTRKTPSRPVAFSLTFRYGAGLEFQ